MANNHAESAAAAIIPTFAPESLMSLRASLSEKEDISLGGFSDRFSKPRKGTLLQYTTSSDSSGLSFGLTCEGRGGEIGLLSQTRRGLGAACAATDLRGLLFRRALDAVRRFFVGAGGEAGVAAVLSQLSQVRSVLLPLYQDATPQRLEPRSFGTSEMTGGSWGEGRGGGSVPAVCCTSGEGRSFSGSEVRGLVRSLAPRMVRRFLAMTACCSTEQ